MDDKIIVRIDADFKEIIPEFLNNRRQDIATIETCLDEKDYETIRVIGHSMKGSGASYGFRQITEIGKAIEDGAKKISDQIIEQNTQELSEFMDNLHVEFIEDSDE